MQSLVLPRQEFEIVHSKLEDDTQYPYVIRDIQAYAIFSDGLKIGTLFRHDDQNISFCNALMSQQWLSLGCNCCWCRQSEKLLIQPRILQLVPQIYGFEIPLFHICSVGGFYIMRHKGQVIGSSLLFPTLSKDPYVFADLPFDPDTATGRAILAEIQRVNKR